MKTELGQVWKNVFGSLVPIEGEEEEGQLLVKIEKGSQLSFSRLSVFLEQVQESIKAPLMLDISLREDGSFYVCVVKGTPFIEEITDIEEEVEVADNPIAEEETVEEAPKKRGRKKAEVENAIPAKEGE